MVDDGQKTDNGQKIIAGFEDDEYDSSAFVDAFINVDAEVKKIYDDLFEGLIEYCTIPEKFRHCLLYTQPLDIDALTDADLEALALDQKGVIYDPKLPHLEAIELFNCLRRGEEMFCENGDLLRPQIGGYLYGPPGVGKTHLMVAYAKYLKAALDENLSGLMSIIEGAVRQICQIKLETEEGPIEDGQEKRVFSLEGDDPYAGSIAVNKSSEESYQDAMTRLRAKIREYKYKPTDIVFISFDPLCEMYRNRTVTLDALIQAPVVFIDDVYPKGPEEARIIANITERRYESGRRGTFMNGNCDDKELADKVGEDKKISQRLHSRWSELFYTIDFEGCVDWRTTVGKYRITKVQEHVRGLLKEQGHVFPEKEV